MKATADKSMIVVKDAKGSVAIVHLFIDETPEPITPGSKVDVRTMHSLGTDASHRGVNYSSYDKYEPGKVFEDFLKESIEKAIQGAKDAYNAIVTKRLDWHEEQFIPFRASVEQLEWRSQNYRYVVDLKNRVAKILSHRGGLIAAHSFHMNFFTSPEAIFSTIMRKL
jgi:hypothetical protein